MDDQRVWKEVENSFWEFEDVLWEKVSNKRKMSQANQVLIAMFKPPFLTIMGKLTYIIILWQAICDHLEKKEHCTGTLFSPGTVTKGGSMRGSQ